MEINFERLVSRGMARELSHMLDIADIRMSVNKILEIAILGAFGILIVVAFLLFYMKFPTPIDAGAGLGSAVMYVAAIYMIIEFKIDGRKTALETMLPDYFQVASANLRSGIALDRALILAARPEFTFLSESIKDMGKRVTGGETMEDSLKDLANRYNSNQLSHAIRMMIEAIRYGGAMADLLDQLSKDLRSQQMIQKEVAGQLFMYSIFIAFAAVIAAPALYGLTSQMIIVTDKVWAGILAQNPGGLPTIGVSFLKPSPPKITPAEYHDFSIAAIVIITGFASLIMSAISSGSSVKGLRYMPIFVVVGLAIFIIVRIVIGAFFANIGSV
ncbi:MAG: type II secretion system F family protein [Candidatus Marsarchaeota archaeon]|jgi:Flp pilus assembly protein TadB|nr:type II secretion system F family protein [Candidatus Marsarchaeota archaeon]